MADFLLDDEAIKAEEAANEERKNKLALIGGLSNSLGNAQGWGNFYLGKMNPQNDAGARTADTIAKNIQDPTEKRRKMAQLYLEQKKTREAQDQDAMFDALKDDNSTQSKAFKFALEKRGIPTEGMTAYELKMQGYSPAKLNEIEAQSGIEFEKQKRLREMDNASQERRHAQELSIRRQDKADDRTYKEEQKRVEDSKLSDKHIETISDFDKAESDLNSILGQLGDKSEWTGTVDGRVPDMLIGDDQVAWRAAVGKYKDQYRKAITGAGANASEIAKLEMRLPNETDTLANFKAKAKAAINELNRHRRVYTENLKKGGKNVSQFSRPSGDDETVTVIAPDGRKRSIPKSKLPDAIAAGGKLAGNAVAGGGQ